MQPLPALERTRSSRPVAPSASVEFWDNAGVGLLKLDSKGQIEAINLTGAALLGKTSVQAAVRHPLSRYLAPPSIAEFMKHLWSTLNSSSTQSLLVQTRSGTSLELISRAMLDEDQAYLMVTLIDRQKQARAEADRLTEENCLRGVLEVLQDAVLTLDVQGKILLSNPAASKMFLYEPQDLQRLSCVDLFGWEISRLWSEGIRQVQSRRQDGSSFPSYLVLTRVQLEKKPRFLLVLRDLSDVRRSHSELAELAEQERKRLGQLVHDDLGQLLTALAYMCQSLQRRLQSSDSLEMAERLTKLAQQAVSQARTMARQLFPVQLEGKGLIAALQELASSTAVVFEMPCLMTGDTAIRVPYTVSLHLYRLAQEAVTNAVKHGKAERIDIKLARRGEEVILSVCDDGQGLPAQIPEGKGLGLKSMRIHASMIGAHLELKSETGCGTQVVCRYLEPRW